MHICSGAASATPRLPLRGPHVAPALARLQGNPQARVATKLTREEKSTLLSGVFEIDGNDQMRLVEKVQGRLSRCAMAAAVPFLSRATEGISHDCVDSMCTLRCRAPAYSQSRAVAMLLL